MTRRPELSAGGDSNIYIRPNQGKAGDVVKGHKHNFDHAAIMFIGRIRIVTTYPDGTVRDQEFAAPSYCLIRAGIEHEITFLEAGEFWCVYAHRTSQGTISEVFTGWQPAYE